MATADVDDAIAAVLAAEKKLSPTVFKGVSQLSVTVIQARNLPRMDFTGHSDPYVVVNVEGKRYPSAYIADTGEPVFNFSVTHKSQELLDSLKKDGVTFELWDKDDVSKDDFMGFCVLKDGIESLIDQPSQHIWLTLYNRESDGSKGKKERGKIEVSVQIISEVSKISVREWTHMVELDVLYVSNLKKPVVPWAYASPVSSRKRHHKKRAGSGAAASGAAAASSSSSAMAAVTGPSDMNPRVRLEWSIQVMTTGSSPKPAIDTATPEDKALEWDERCYLFLDTARHKGYKLRLRLEAGAARTLSAKDVLPEAYVDASLFFAALDHLDGPISEDSKKILSEFKGTITDRSELEDGAGDEAESKTGPDFSTKFFDICVPLSKSLVAADSQLASLSDMTAGLTEDETIGHIYLRFSINERKVVEEQFYASIIEKFDRNGDGKLQYDELQSLLLLLEMDTPISEIGEWFAKFSLDKDAALDKAEVMGMLRDHKFTSSTMFSNLFFKIIKDSGTADPEDIMTRSVMSTITRDGFTVTGRKVIEVKDRSTGLIVCENIPDYVWYALKSMYSSSAGRMLSSKMSSLLHSMSVRQGSKYDSKESSKEIESFIALHSLPVHEIIFPESGAFETFNDFFARSIDVGKYRPMSEAETDIASAADCRLMAFPKFVDSFVWVKGSKFTLENILGPRADDLVPKLHGGPFIIFRLAPQDYHRWHWPVSGNVTNVTPIDGALYTVNPLAVNSALDVYTENKRCVIEIDTGDDAFGTVVNVAIAATAVGSYRLFKDGSTPLGDSLPVAVKRGDVSGEFRFGGSTVLMFLEPGKVELSSDLVSNSMKNLETLVKVRETVAAKLGSKSATSAEA